MVKHTKKEVLASSKSAPQIKEIQANKKGLNKARAKS